MQSIDLTWGQIRRSIQSQYSESLRRYLMPYLRWFQLPFSGKMPKKKATGSFFPCELPLVNHIIETIKNPSMTSQVDVVSELVPQPYNMCYSKCVFPH